VLSWLDQALDYARRTGERMWEVSFLCGSVGSLDVLGHWDDAFARAAEAEPHAETEFVRGLLLWRVLPLCRRGQLDRALELIEANADVAASGNQEFASGYRMLSAYVFAAAGREQEALDAALEGLASPGAAGDSWWLPFNALDTASMLPVDQAERILALVEERNWRQGPAVAAQLARLRARLPGRDSEAELRTAEELFGSLGMPFFVAAVRLERGELLLAEKREDAASTLLADARAEFARLGAAPWVERVDAQRGLERAVL
jgi:hypothetical protein